MGRWRFERLETNTLGQLVGGTPVDITDIISPVRVEKTVGDEMWLKSGDIEIETLAPITEEANFQWLAAYYRGQIFDVYQINSNPGTLVYEKDEKRDRYKYRFVSIQKIFYDDCKAASLIHEAVDRQWGEFVAAACGLKIEEIKIVNDLGAPTFILDRWGFSLVDLIKAMQGSNSRGYHVIEVTCPGPVLNEDNLPILYRGQSYDWSSVAVGTAFSNTFGNAGVTWLDAFKFASFAFNAFIRVKPSIQKFESFDHLILNVDLIPKIELASGSPIELIWLERKLIKEKYKIDGVKLTSSILNAAGDPSFEYEQGNVDGDNVFRRDVDVADPDAEIGFADDTLYWSWGEYNAGTGEYDITEPDDTARGYFSGGFVEPYYQDLIDSGDGYEGEIISSGEEDLLDQVNIDGNIAQINKIEVDRSGRIKIEAIKIA